MLPSELEQEHEPEVKSDSRIVRVSGSLLQQPPRRFRLNTSANEQVAGEEPSKPPGMPTISSEEE